MATVKQYASRMRDVYAQVGAKMGTDLTGGPKSVRVAAAAVLVVVAVVVKTLVDKGVITDVELTAQLDALAADVYNDEPS